MIVIIAVELLIVIIINTGSSLPPITPILPCPLTITNTTTDS